MPQLEPEVDKTPEQSRFSDDVEKCQETLNLACITLTTAFDFKVVLAAMLCECAAAVSTQREWESICDTWKKTVGRIVNKGESNETPR